jgi:hypothetical protein
MGFYTILRIVFTTTGLRDIAGRSIDQSQTFVTTVIIYTENIMTVVTEVCE